jgi:hypothetical protein
MKPDEMLRELGVNHEQLHLLLQKFREFNEKLDEQQKKVVHRSLPTLTEAMAAFGPDVTREELLKLFEGDERLPPVMLCFPLHRRRTIPEKK